MIGLSVAIGRFVEALFWAILRVGAGVALLVLGGLVALGLAVGGGRALWRRARR